MKIKITSELPRVWSNHPLAKGIICEGDIGIFQSKIKAKVIIFNSTKELRWFWNKCLNKGDLGVNCLGAVNSLRVEFLDLKTLEIDVVEVDKNYFCVIGLVKNHLTMNIITHESVHAGFCYNIRKGKRNKFTENFEDDSENMTLQESVAYPAGLVASGIVDLARKHSLI